MILVERKGCGSCEFYGIDETDGEPTCKNVHSEFYGWKSREGFPMMTVCRQYQPMRGPPELTLKERSVW